MKHVILIPLMSLSVLAGCGALKKLQHPDAAPSAAVEVAPPVATTTLMPAMGLAKSAASLDTASEAEKKAAVASSGQAGQKLGSVVVALGSPAEQGFWVKSALVKTAGKGRVVTASGASANVDLLPGDGAASLSLSAFRALGLGLTDLPEVTIYAN
jgi:predicted small lipoprotein YifL